jgi:tetratricopeptide (TPR) repeat protein
MSEPDVQMVYRTFFSVFPQGAIYRTGPGDILLIGGEIEPEMRPERLQALYTGEARSAFWLASLELVDPRMLYATYLASRQEVIDYLNRRGPGFLNGPINSDDRPLLEFQAPLSLFSGKGVVKEATSFFTSLVPPGQSQDVAAQQAAILGRLLLDLPLETAEALTRLRTLDPTGNAWYPNLLEPMLAGRPVDFDALLGSARPQDEGWLVRLAIAWKLKTQSFEGLPELLARALSDPPQGSRLWLLLAAARDAARRGLLEPSRALYRQALPLTRGYEPLAESAILGQVQDWDEEALRQAIARNPFSASARFHLARLLHESKKTEEALAQATESYRLYPANADLLELISELYREKGDADRVLRFASAARRLRAIEEARSKGSL